MKQRLRSSNGISRIPCLGRKPGSFRSRLFVVVILFFLLGAFTLLFSGSAPAPGTKVPVADTEIANVPAAGRRIAITFDAGGDCDLLSELLAALASAKVHSTFFITGHWAIRHPDLVWRIHQGGHEIANHSWSHCDFTQISKEAIRSEVLRTDRLLQQLVGEPIPPLFRAPYGARDPRVLRTLRGLGYQSIYWSLDSLDSDPPSKSSQFLNERVTAHPDEALNGAIVLMHVGEPATAAALPSILTNLRKRKFQIVTFSQLECRGRHDSPH